MKTKGRVSPPGARQCCEHIQVQHRPDGRHSEEGDQQQEDGEGTEPGGPRQGDGGTPAHLP